MKLRKGPAMRNLIVFAILAALVTASVGCEAVVTPGEAISAEAALWFAQAGAITGAWVTPRGTVAFCAEGTSVAAKPDDPIHLLEARCAAATMAKANLLALIAGEEVEGHMTVGDLMFESQEAAVRVEGFLVRAIVTFPETPAMDAPGVVTARAAVELTRRQLRSLNACVE